MNKLLFILFVFLSFQVSGSHLKGGEIIVKRINAIGRDYTIRLTLFEEQSAPIEISQKVKINGVEIVLNYSGGETVSANFYAYYQASYSFPANGIYTVSFTADNQSEAINNQSRKFFIKTSFTIDPFVAFELLNPNQHLVFETGINQILNYSFQTKDADKHKIEYRLIRPLESEIKSSDSYTFPQNAAVNLYSGQLSWKPTQIGTYSFAVEIIKSDNSTVLQSIIRQFIIVVSGVQNPLILIKSSNYPLDENQAIKLDLNKNLKIYLQNTKIASQFEILKTNLPVAQLIVIDSSGFKSAEFNLNTTNLKDGPYYIVFRLTENNRVSDLSLILYSNANQSIILNEDVVENESDATVFPNPFTSQFTIKTDVQNFEYKIYDLNGIIVLQGISDESTDLVSFSDQKPGAYFYQILTGNRIVKSGRLVKY